jgi:hypothetical protein
VSANRKSGHGTWRKVKADRSGETKSSSASDGTPEDLSRVGGEESGADVLAKAEAAKRG